MHSVAACVHRVAAFEAYGCRLELAVALLAMRQPLQAAAEADAAVAQRPAWFAARELRAQIMLRLGHDVAALVDCEAALESLDSETEGDGGDGGGDGDGEELEVPPLAAEVIASRSRVWELKSHALLGLDRPAEALHAAEAAQQEHALAGPPPLRLRLARAEAMRALGRQPDALQALGAALQPSTPTQTTQIPTPWPCP